MRTTAEQILQENKVIKKQYQSIAIYADIPQLMLSLYCAASHNIHTNPGVVNGPSKNACFAKF